MKPERQKTILLLVETIEKAVIEMQMIFIASSFSVSSNFKEIKISQ